MTFCPLLRYRLSIQGKPFTLQKIVGTILVIGRRRDRNGHSRLLFKRKICHSRVHLKTSHQRRQIFLLFSNIKVYQSAPGASAV